LKTTPNQPTPKRQRPVEKKRCLTGDTDYCQNHCQRNHQPNPHPKGRSSVNGALQTNSSTMTHC
jgi:hypothetical protein